MGLLVNGTQEEKDIIMGQAYFFRGYLHYEILRNWGHIAYIDTVWNASDVITPPILSYEECAKRIDADLADSGFAIFRRTGMPRQWDRQTATKNAGRATKGAAWAVIGLNALNAASPLMSTDATSPNNPDSTHYDIEWCKTAAEAYGEVLKLAVSSVAGGTGEGGYDLEQWQDYHKNFWSLDGHLQNGKEIVWTYPNTR